MSITIEMSAHELSALKQLTRLENDADAVIAAAREFVRLRRLRELKDACGNLDFEANWQKLEELELAETPVPQ